MILESWIFSVLGSFIFSLFYSYHKECRLKNFIQVFSITIILLALVLKMSYCDLTQNTPY